MSSKFDPTNDNFDLFLKGKGESFIEFMSTYDHTLEDFVNRTENTIKLNRLIIKHQALELCILKELEELILSTKSTALAVWEIHSRAIAAREFFKEEITKYQKEKLPTFIS